MTGGRTRILNSQTLINNGISRFFLFFFLKELHGEKCQSFLDRRKEFEANLKTDCELHSNVICVMKLHILRIESVIYF